MTVSRHGRKTLKSYAGEVEVGSAWRRKALLRREREEREWTS